MGGNVHRLCNRTLAHHQQGVCESWQQQFSKAGGSLEGIMQLGHLL